jgi:two-component sensor histidine kinase/PAS domain-containing protein
VDRVVRHVLSRPPGAVARFGAAVATVVVATLVRLAFNPVLGSQIPFASFFFATLVSALYGGVGPAILATLLGGLAAWFLWFDPPFQFASIGGTEAVLLGFYAATSAMIIATVAALHRAMAAARRSEQRWRALFTALPDSAVVYEAVRSTPTGPFDDLRRVEVNEGWRALVGPVPDDFIGRTFRESFPEAAESWLPDLLRVAATGEPLQMERYLERPDRWVEVRVYSPQPGQCAAITRDVTARRRAEQTNQLITREVEHRARNLISLILSLVQLTKADSAAQFASKIKSRIQGLASTHSLLARQAWDGSDLQSLAREQLASQQDRVSLSGPPVMLDASRAQDIGMVLHELATNALKYGALSVAGGRVAVDWQLANADIVLIWTERGGPEPRPPERKGFGSLLIAQLAVQLGGGLTYDWGAEGLSVALRFPARPPTDAQPGPLVQEADATELVMQGRAT